MRSLSRKLSVALLFVMGSAVDASAASTTTSAYGFVITVEPIVGYQYLSFDTPTPRRGGMLIYGARVSAGRPHISAEGEYTRGTTTEGFSSPIQSVTTTQENVSLGVRGTYNLAKSLDTFVRLGGQASKFRNDTLDVSGLTTTGEGKWQIHPYLGTGLQFSPADALSAGIEANYVFNSLEDFTQNTVRLSTSLRVHFNTR